MNVHKSPADFTTHHKKGTVNSVDCLKLVVSWVERILGKNSNLSVDRQDVQV